MVVPKASLTLQKVLKKLSCLGILSYLLVGITSNALSLSVSVVTEAQLASADLQSRGFHFARFVPYP
jgi:hypothetical protein